MRATLARDAALALVVGGLLIFLVFFVFRSGSRRASSTGALIRKGRSSVRPAASANSVLFVGCRDSGKTTLFHRLVFDAIPQTTTSAEPAHIRASEIPNEELRKLNFDLVDCPGHPKLQPAIFSSINKCTKRIVLVLDASSRACLKGCAELLLQLMKNEEVHRHRIPLLVCCAKADLPGARQLKTLRADLEREISRIRSDECFVGVRGQSFAFAQLGGDSAPVNFVACSAQQDGELGAVVRAIAGSSDGGR